MKRVLIFCPTFRLEPETTTAILHQEGSFDAMFTKDNPFEEGARNIRYAYNKMRDTVLGQMYDKVLVIESDIIPPLDALVKLLAIDADVVTGLYALRQSSAPNLVLTEPRPEGTTGWNWDDVRKSWGQTVDVGGGSMGCVMIDRSVLEFVDFKSDVHTAPDVPFMQWCRDNKLNQKARLDVVCGHKTPLGVILRPDKRLGCVKEI